MKEITLRKEIPFLRVFLFQKHPYGAPPFKKRFLFFYPATKKYITDATTTAPEIAQAKILF